LGSETTPEQPGWQGVGPDGAHPRRHRPPRRVAWFRWIVGLAVGGALVWMSFSPGGLRERYFGIKSSITGTVSKLTESRDLEGATKTFNGWFAQQGLYPNYTQSDLIERTDGPWGAGLDVSWCSNRDVVLTSLTASGIVSRLLIDGKTVGDVEGRKGCPADLVNPVPWER
jgi:hypothetical protein